MKIFVSLAMIFMHIIDDFFLQSAGFLCRCKQKDWWEQNENNPKYKNDYKIGLYLHAFEWTFMMMLPIAIYYQFNLDWIFLFIFIFNVFIHAWTDDLKANKKEVESLGRSVRSFRSNPLYWNNTSLACRKATLAMK